MTGDRLLCAAMALLLGSALSCGGSGTGVKGGLDPDLGEGEGAGQARARSRQRQTKTIQPEEIPLLSLEGLLPEPEAPTDAGKEGGEGEGAESATPQTAGAPSSPKAPPVGPRPAPRGASPAAPQGEVQPTLPSRNLFAFEEDPAVVAERQKQALAAVEIARKAEELRRKWQGPPPPPPPPQPPQIPRTGKTSCRLFRGAELTTPSVSPCTACGRASDAEAISCRRSAAS